MKAAIKFITSFVLLMPYLLFASDEGTKELKIKKLSDNVYQHISYKVVDPGG